MARKKKVEIVENLPEAEVTVQPITETLEKNYMPYVMSVIISRAIPEIDGFKPSHRKLLYTMYKMGLLTGQKTKSANVVGQTMKLNPHGDASIYETMVRLTRGNESLLHPFVDSKGSFGKQYSRDMAYAASRYTEVKLDPFCAELFKGIDKNAVDMVPNYDNTMEEPTILPTTFPNVLVSPNLGIAVGMTSSICSFNLAEICDGTIALLKNPNVKTEKLMDIIKAPDFPGGGLLVYEKDKMTQVFETGVGAIKLRARYAYDKANNSIDILQIPYSSCIEAIMNKVADLMKAGKLKEVSDFRDAIDLNGFKLTFDLRKGADPEKVMAKLYKMTPLESNFDCNFNVLINGTPKLLGVADILREWIAFRSTCVHRELSFDLQKKKDKLHLLLGLSLILLDIDKAIAIIRGTEKDEEVVPNLMKGFSLTKVQAEYVAEIKLRHLNHEYIVNRLSEIENLQKDIADLEDILGDELKIRAYIAGQLHEIKKKYGKPRKTQIIGEEDIKVIDEDELFDENYNVRIVVTHDGYIKKITMQSLRGNDEQKLKEGDYVVYSEDTDNKGDIIFFTNQAQVYRARVADFEQQKASSLGEYIPAKLSMDDGEYPVMAKVLYNYNPLHNAVFVFENGKGVRIPITAYETKGNRRKLTSAFSTASPIVAAFYEETPFDVLLLNNKNKGIVISTSLIPVKSTKTSVGVTLLSLKKGETLKKATNDEKDVKKATGCRKRKIPSTASSLK
ncbi:MAG: topoisomerase IV [Clostridia bacterium]|nr:topoisomerase IV [Clostridia bacterium]